MRKPQQLALFAAGKISDFGILSFPAVRDRLGPVRASSLRVASRMVNQLRAGHAVQEFKEFDHCPVILICFPESRIAAAIRELSSQNLDWSRKTVILCNDWAPGSSHIELLRGLGASVGVLLELSGEGRPLYLLESDNRTLRETRRLLVSTGANLVPVLPGSRLSLLAALQCAGPLFFSLLMAGTECLRNTGIPAPVTGSLLQRSFARTFRTYLSSGKKAPRDLRREWNTGALHPQITPRLAKYLNQTSQSASQFLARASDGC